MAYTEIDDPSAYFQTTLYTGNGTAIGSGGNAITNSGNSSLQPDMVWIKNRVDTDSHSITDSVRGVTKYVLPDSDSQGDTDANGLAVFGSNGFTVGSNNTFNGNTHAFVSWNWKAGTSFTNDASSTSIGTIDSAGSFNNDAGFSICSFTGNGTSGASVKHGLSTKPAWMLIKNRDETDSWQVYHHKNTSAPATETLQLNENGATSDTSNRWNDTEPTTAILTLGNNTTVNKNGVKYIGYIFSEKKGYSKFGSYVGNNNADGTFVYTGFKPALVIAKNSVASEGWSIFDNKRSTSGGNNVINDLLVPSSTEAEISQNVCDFVSNGFKFRHVDGKYHNNGGTYIYMAFAETPMVTSTGIPTTAR